MSISPFIRPIQVQGGTFYTFSSAAEDLSLTFNNSGKKFTFSKYALLNLPNFARPSADAPNEENFIQLDTIPGAFRYVNAAKTFNQMFGESLQNYVLNLETIVTSQPSYNPDALQTVSERIFFKWLKEIGALRFTPASTQETTATDRFTEEINSTSYSRVLQYIGEIDMVNSLKSLADAYSEVYINVPTAHGGTPLSLFKTTEDENYYSSLNLINAPQDSTNDEYLYGRTYSQVNPAALDTHAFFDSLLSSYGISASQGEAENLLPVLSTPGEYQLLKYDPITHAYTVDWWFEYPEANSYWTQPADSISGKFNDASNTSYKIKGVKDNENTATEVTFKRSNLDGIGIDFNISNYVPISTNPSISSFSDFNSVGESSSFEFNTVLLYYDVIDSSTGDSATNLFGVLFLDNVKDTLINGSYIPRLKKYKPNRVTGLNGNAYGFKINLKFDVNAEQAAVVTAVNEYANFSMHVFLEALNKMQSATDLMTQNQEDLTIAKQEINALYEILDNTNPLTQLDSRVTNLETQVEAAGLMFSNSTEIMNLIARNYQEIVNIYNNETSVQMSYNLETIKQGEGINIDKTVANQITITNDYTTYNLSDSPIMSIIDDFTQSQTEWTKYLSLRHFNNYIKISNHIDTAFDKNVKIYIDDTDIKWKTGQSYKIVIDKDWPMDMYTLGAYTLTVLTNAAGNGDTIYNIEAGRLESTDFFNATSSLTLEIICLDASTYSFTYDIKY